MPGQLPAPQRQPRPIERKRHEGAILTERPNRMRGIAATGAFVLQDGQAAIFALIEHGAADCLGTHGDSSYQVTDATVRLQIVSFEPPVRGQARRRSASRPMGRPWPRPRGIGTGRNPSTATAVAGCCPLLGVSRR